MMWSTGGETFPMIVQRLSFKEWLPLKKVCEQWVVVARSLRSGAEQFETSVVREDTRVFL